MKTLLKIIYSIIFLFFNSFAQRYVGEANPGAIVVEGNARFEILTPHIIRMEWSEDGKFEDHASLTFTNRKLPVLEFTKNKTTDELIIKSDVFELHYKLNSGMFNDENLRILFQDNGKNKSWVPGKINNGNLLGTYRTLDGINGATDLEPGLLSREGWTLIDDSKRPLFDNSDWQWVMPRPEKDEQDFYLFMYGNQYKTILKEFTEVAGKIPFPPKFAFGYWWSRYWKYTDQDFKELINEFKIHDVPLDVLVIDMDWHIVNKPEWFKNGERLKDQAGQSYGWTGFTWNKAVFPNPQKFLAYTNKLNLKTCLNLHPASGIQPHEEIYPEFARAMGQDPAKKKYVPFDITNKKFAENYFNLILHPMEKEGIDFWWLDWQQWSTTKIEGVNPTFYLNYVHFTDMEREGTKRPLLYHRWGGLGNHRYQIGFSGDTHITWQSLDFQPFFTATASNVCYGYWSHDIGGHYSGDKKNPELYTRWIEWGIFSPILRTHCTKDREIERRIWAYKPEYFNIMRNAIKLRYSLIPYIYTEARAAYDTGISILRPMYYDYPSEEIAYNMKHQYMFGDDFIVAPVTHPVGKDNSGTDSLFTMQKIWLPEGNWIEWFSGTLLKGNQVYERPVCLEDIPVFVKAGAIIPMQKDVNNTADNNGDLLILNIFPGEKGKTKIYDDAGNDDNYKSGKFTFTGVSFQKSSEGEISVEISPIKGEFEGMPLQRKYELRFPVSYPPEEVTINGMNCTSRKDKSENTWNYDGNTFTSYIYSKTFSVHEPVKINVKFMSEDLNSLSGRKKQINSLIKLARIVNGNNFREKIWDEEKSNSDDINVFAETGDRISTEPGSIKKELDNFKKGLPGLISEIEEQGKNFPALTPYLDLIKSSY
jgi:alpha-glucosidase (family GH31 glycosyl hydrolase)